MNDSSPGAKKPNGRPQDEGKEPVEGLTSAAEATGSAKGADNHHGHDHSHDDHRGHDHGEHDHEHDHDHDHGGQEDQEKLLEAIAAARTGLKSRVQEFVDALPSAQVFIPLAEDIPDVEEGQEMTWEGELTFRPHMILSPDEDVYAVAYSHPELVEEMAQVLGWETSGGDLKMVCVPIEVAFDLSQLSVDGQSVSGIVFNPSTDHELVLQRDEAASIGQGSALPLVGYVAELPADEEEIRIVEGAEPPPKALIQALSEAGDVIDEVRSVRVETTFNEERDREPHLTIFLTVVPGLDRQAVADRIMEQAGSLIPAPGYADIVFRDAPN